MIRHPPLTSAHRDYAIVQQLESALAHQAHGLDKLKQALPSLIRAAIDEVIDAPRTGRVHARELEKTEKTYIGTKVEILVRNFFRLPKGILDLTIDGLDVDVKNTLGDTWMIPREAVGKPCILVASDEDKHTCFFGIFIAHLDNLTSGVNQDQKRSVSAAGFMNIHWILIDEPYPVSFWSKLGTQKTHAIMRGKSGSERVEALFREVQAIPVHRDIVQAVAQQKDYMKRLRKNGGARDVLAREGIAILSATYDSLLIRRLGLPPLDRDEFISFKPTSAADIAMLQRAEKIA
ncbi:MAG: NaeI family type II restriction endonuclease [Alphaproteobacteria bacterium]|nr:NaeI family type II restriction endonuclease [Alphaproteobacteria bacterium]